MGWETRELVLEGVRVRVVVLLCCGIHPVCSSVCLSVHSVMSISCCALLPLLIVHYSTLKWFGLFSHNCLGVYHARTPAHVILYISGVHAHTHTFGGGRYILSLR